MSGNNNHRAAKKLRFSQTDQGMAAKQVLLDMVASQTYATTASYSADSLNYPDNKIPFVDKHLEYLSLHPATDPQHYLANLRLSTRIRLN